LQHQAVATQRDDDIRIRRLVIAVGRNQSRQRFLRFRAGARDEGNPVKSCGCGHGIAKVLSALAGQVQAEVLVVYTTLAALVEMIANN